MLSPPAPTLAASWTIGPIELAAMLMLAGALVALVVALKGGWPGAASSAPRERDEDAAQAAEELRALMAEARLLADELAEQLDARSEELRALLARVERLDAASSSIGVDHAQREIKPRPASASADPAIPASSPQLGGHEAVPPISRPRVNPIADGVEPDAIAREIYRLSDSGLPPVEIASRLGQHTGKVELILALRR